MISSRHCTIPIQCQVALLQPTFVWAVQSERLNTGRPCRYEGPKASKDGALSSDTATSPLLRTSPNAEDAESHKD